MSVNTRRPYTLGQRAISAQSTHDAIIAATLTALSSLPLAEITLEKIATVAGCTVRTVIRRMGSRDRAIDLALESVLSEAEQQPLERWTSVDDGLQSIVEHYVRRGDLVWSILAQESSDPRFAGLARIGRDMHRKEVLCLIALHDHTLTADEQLIDLVSVSTDVSTWQVLVKGHQRTPREAGEAMKRMTWALLTSEKRQR